MLMLMWQLSALALVTVLLVSPVYGMLQLGTDPLIRTSIGNHMNISSWKRSELKSMVSKECNVLDYGAIGDGETDDTQAFQKAFDECSNSDGSLIEIPSGYYLISYPITISKSPSAMSISGHGWQSMVLWKGNEDLFVWSCEGSTGHVTITDFAVVSVDNEKDTSRYAFRFAGGLTQSVIRQVLLYGSGGAVANHAVTLIPGAFDFGAVTDTVTMTDCVVWFGVGTLVKIGHGSEVRVQGGRLIGPNNRALDSQSIGIHVTGNNGGVHVVDTDVIGLYEGVRVDDSNGHGSNREIFMSQATIDSNYIGISIYDNSYVDITGLWAASSYRDCIWVSPESTGAIVVLTGGTIFNGGTYGCTSPDTECNGITVNGGTFSLTGVHIRNNQGRGIWVPNEKVNEFTITGCKIFSNYQGMNIQAVESYYTLTGSILSNNEVASVLASANALKQPNICLGVDQGVCT